MEPTTLDAPQAKAKAYSARYRLRLTRRSIRQALEEAYLSGYMQAEADESYIRYDDWTPWFAPEVTP